MNKRALSQISPESPDQNLAVWKIADRFYKLLCGKCFREDNNKCLCVSLIVYFIKEGYVYTNIQNKRQFIKKIMRKLYIYFQQSNHLEFFKHFTLRLHVKAFI